MSISQIASGSQLPSTGWPPRRDRVRRPRDGCGGCDASVWAGFASFMKFVMSSSSYWPFGLHTSGMRIAGSRIGAV